MSSKISSNTADPRSSDGVSLLISILVRFPQIGTIQFDSKHGLLSLNFMLSQTVSAEDIESFMEGFTYINQGIESGDSDKIIKGNVIIQKVLGKQPQFTNQKEFDDLMDSDLALKL